MMRIVLVVWLLLADPVFSQATKRELPPHALGRLGSDAFFAAGQITRISPNGKLVAAASAHEIYLFRTETGEPLRIIAHRKKLAKGSVSTLHPVVDLVFSRDSAWLASADASGQVAICDLSARERPLLIVQHPGVTGLALTQDKRYLFTCGTDGIVRQWIVTNGLELARFHVTKNSAILAVALSADEKLLAVDATGMLAEWDLDTNKETRRVDLGPVLAKEGGTEVSPFPKNAPNHLGLVQNHVRFSSEGRFLFHNRGQRVWDVARGKLLGKLTSHASSSVFAFADSEKFIATYSAGSKPALCLHKLPTCEMIFRHEGPAVTSLALAPGGDWLFVAGASPPLRRLNVSGNNIVSAGAALVPLALDLAPDGSTLVVGQADRTVRVFEVATGAQLGLFSVEDPPKFLRYYPNAKGLIVGFNKSIQHWHESQRGWECVQSFNFPDPITQGPPARAHFLVLVGLQEVALIDGRSGKTLSQFASHDESLPQLSRTGDYALRLRAAPPGRDGDRPKIEPVLYRSSDGVKAGKFPPAEGLLWILSDDAKVLVERSIPFRVYESCSFTQRGSFRIEQSIASGCFTPGGRHLLLGGFDGSLLAVDAYLGQVVKRWPKVHESAIAFIYITPQGYVVTMAEHSILVFRPELWKQIGPVDVAPLDAEQFANLFRILAEKQDDQVGVAMGQLIAQGDATVSYLKDNMRPFPAHPEKRIDELIEASGTGPFANRQKALKELEAIAPLALSYLRKARTRDNLTLEQRRRIDQVLAKIEAAPPANWLQSLRGLEVLERIDTDAARRLAGGLKNSPAARP